MASKGKVEKCVAPKKDIKNEAITDTFENSNTVADQSVDSTPEKKSIAVISEEKNVEIVGCVKSMEKMNDIVAGAETESTPPSGAKDREKFATIEGSACSKVKLADGGGNFSSMELTPPIVTTIHQLDSTVQRSPNISSNVAVPRRAGSICRGLPNLDEPPLVLATHLVPSLPISLFEIVAEIIETVTGRPVVLLHEARSDRSVAKNIVDIAFLPVGDDWEEGSLLPVSFVFEHRLNTAKNPDVYVDVVVARDCARNIEGIIDLRGYRCAVPDRRKAVGAAALLFKHLNLKGENPSFFGNTLDSGSQLAALQMVAGKQTEIAVLESPVIRCHKNTLAGIESVYVLETLGPLPPYRMMLNKKIQTSMRKTIMESLLSAACDDAWTERLGEFGVLGFAEYNVDRYDREDLKSVVTSVRYY